MNRKSLPRTALKNVPAEEQGKRNKSTERAETQTRQAEDKAEGWKGGNRVQRGNITIDLGDAETNQSTQDEQVDDGSSSNSKNEEGRISNFGKYSCSFRANRS